MTAQLYQCGTGAWNPFDGGAPVPFVPLVVDQTVRYGVSASYNWPTGYLDQVAALHANVGYYYNGYGPQNWSLMGSIPSTHALFYETKQTTRSQYDAMLADFPATREGPVYLHYHNEPEDQIEDGAFSMAQWQSRCDDLFAAIAASGKTYIIPSIELMIWTLTLTNNGKWNDGTHPDGARYVHNYIRPGLKHIGWSNYAEKKVSGGHEVATASPTGMPIKIHDYMATLPGVTWSSITGWPIGDAYVNDPVSVQNRLTWTETVEANLKAAGSKNFMWFNVLWPQGDSPGNYQIQDDPGMYTWWQDVLTAAGQW